MVLVRANPKLDSSKTSPKYPVHPKPAKAEPIPPKKLKSKVTPSETIHPKEAIFLKTRKQ